MESVTLAITLSMKENGCVIRDMAGERWFIVIPLFMKASGNMVKGVAKEY